MLNPQRRWPMEARMEPRPLVLGDAMAIGVGSVKLSEIRRGPFVLALREPITVEIRRQSDGTLVGSYEHGEALRISSWPATSLKLALEGVEQALWDHWAVYGCEGARPTTARERALAAAIREVVARGPTALDIWSSGS
jgi:hypothetical protein